MLKQRVLTAIPLAAIVFVTILFLDRVFVTLLLAVLLFLAMLELGNLLRIRQQPPRWMLALTMVALFYLSQPLMDSGVSSLQTQLGLFLWIILPLLMLGYRYSGNWGPGKRLLVRHPASRRLPPSRMRLTVSNRPW